MLLRYLRPIPTNCSLRTLLYHNLEHRVVAILSRILELSHDGPDLVNAAKRRFRSVGLVMKINAHRGAVSLYSSCVYY